MNSALSGVRVCGREPNSALLGSNQPTLSGREQPQQRQHRAAAAPTRVAGVPTAHVGKRPQGFDLGGHGNLDGDRLAVDARTSVQAQPAMHP